MRTASWADDYDDSITGNGVRCHSYRAQAFPEEVYDWLVGELEEAKWETFAYQRISSWLRRNGREVDMCNKGLLVDGKLVIVQRQRSEHPVPKLLPSSKSPSGYILTNKNVDSCLLFKATENRWPKKLGTYFPDKTEAMSKTIPAL